MESSRRISKSVPSRRRGIALILVLGMIAMTVAVSYAMMRAQVQTTLLQNNSQNTMLARQAAEAGLIRAIRKMSYDGEWGGVGTTMAGSVDSQSSYMVTYTAGDASLTPGDPNYGQFPYRVTVVSTGTALNSGDSTIPATYVMSAVLQLVPRAFNTSATPARWASLNSYTCYQWNSASGSKDVDLDLPIQIQGNAYLEGKLKFAQKYGWNSTTRQRYMTDLKLMKDETSVDYRPFTGNVVLGSGRQDTSTATELTNWLGLTVTTATPVGGDPWAYVNAPTTYRLYEGGPVYTVGNVANTYGTSLAGQTIGPNVLSNPLGVFVAGNDLDFWNGNSFTGILFMDNTKKVTFRGTGTQFNGVSLALDGISSTYQMPALMESSDLVIDDGSITTVNGLVICWDKFELKDGSQNTIFNVQGRLFVDEFKLGKRNEWNGVSSGAWSTQYTLFNTQNPTLVRYLPTWMDQSLYNLKMQPKIVFQPPANINYHWPDWTQPIYTKAAGDVGLRWNIVSWRDGS